MYTSTNVGGKTGILKAGTYRVGRIEHAEVLAETFVKPDEFDLAAWWAASSAAFDQSQLVYRCWVRLSPYAQQALPRVVPHNAVRRMLAEAGPPDADGWRTLELLLEGEDVAVDRLAGLGDGVEILEPPELRWRAGQGGGHFLALVVW